MCAARWKAIPRCGAQRSSVSPTSASARHRWPWSSCAHGATADSGDVAEYLQTRLARYEIPTDIAIVDAIPRTPSGKPDLTAVGDHFRDR